MCDLCKKVEEGQPDLGSGAFFDYSNLDTAINVDPTKGVRISQARDVSYVGPQGAENRHEVESIYIPWDQVTDMVLHLVAIQIDWKKGPNDT